MDVDPDDLVAAIRIVARRQALLDPSITRRVIEEFSRGNCPGLVHLERLDALTDREREVVALVATGETNEEIARELIISPLTPRPTSAGR